MRRSPYHEKMCSGLVPGRNFARRASQVGSRSDRVPRLSKSGFHEMPVFFTVMPVAMATWFGALSVEPSRIVLAPSDHAHVYPGCHLPAINRWRFVISRFSTASPRSPSSMITSAFGLSGLSACAVIGSSAPATIASAAAIMPRSATGFIVAVPPLLRHGYFDRV